MAVTLEVESRQIREEIRLLAIDIREKTLRIEALLAAEQHEQENDDGGS